MRDNLEAHELAAIFPLMDDESLAGLTKDIEKGGLLEPIIRFEGKILDGRSRYAACLVAGVTPTFDIYNGDDPLAFVVSKNLHRRHLDASQRAAIAAKLAALKHGQRQSGKFAAVPTQKQAAELMNVSPRSVRIASKLLDEGSAETIAAVRAGELSLNAAAKTLPPTGRNVGAVPAARRREADSGDAPAKGISKTSARKTFAPMVRALAELGLYSRFDTLSADNVPAFVTLLNECPEGRRSQIMKSLAFLSEVFAAMKAEDAAAPADRKIGAVDDTNRVH